MGLVHRAQRKLDVVGVQHAETPDLVLQRQGLGLELDPVLAGDVGPHVHPRRLLQVGMPELEDNLRIAHREPVHVLLASAQDEGVVVEPEVGRVEEKHLSDAGARILEAFAGEVDVCIGGGLLHKLRELPKGVDRVEAVALQNDLGLEILQLVEWMPVTVPALLELGNVLGLRLPRVLLHRLSLHARWRATSTSPSAPGSWLAGRTLDEAVRGVTLVKNRVQSVPSPITRRSSLSAKNGMKATSTMTTDASSS